MPFILGGAQILRPKVRQVTDVYCSFATNLSSFPHLNTFFKTFTVQKCHFCKCDAALFAAILLLQGVVLVTKMILVVIKCTVTK